jgi:hypothetical protein
MATLSKETILAALDKSSVFVERCLLVVYANQTEDEKNSEVTSHHNGKGFRGNHAGFGSKLAKWVLTSKNAEGERLTEKQLVCVRKMMKNYTKQLLAYAEMKAAEKAKN